MLHRPIETATQSRLSVSDTNRYIHSVWFLNLPDAHTVNNIFRLLAEPNISSALGLLGLSGFS